MVHNGLLDDFRRRRTAAEVFNAPDAPANPDEAIAYIEDAIRNGEAASMRSWDTQMALAQDAMTERQWNLSRMKFPTKCHKRRSSMKLPFLLRRIKS